MADLLAIISHDPRAPVSSDELKGLVETHESLRGPARQRLQAGAERVRACVLGREGPTIGVETDGDGWTAWAGSRCRQPGAMAAPLTELDGQFALLRLGSDGETVELTTDPLGMKPLFAAVRGGRTYAATSALVLAKHLRATPSALGLQAYLRSGLQFGRLTQWEGIERLRPAERRRFAAAGDPAIDTYTEPHPYSDGQPSLAEAAALCIERAAATLAARYEGERPWIDLTGGFDSRLLALLSRRAGIEFLANTVGDEDDEDVRLARRIAAARDWPWTRIGLPEDWSQRLPELLPEAVAWGDGHLDALNLAAVMLGHREKAEAGTTVLLNGGGGEEFRDHPWGHELWRAGRSNRVDYGRLIAWRILLPVDVSALRTDPTAAVTAAFREELETRAAPFAERPNTFQGDLLYAFKMTGHSGAYQAAAGAAIDLEVPFYLQPILNSVIAVAPGQRRFHRLMREMMRQLDPGVAAIPTETGGPAEPPRLGNLHRFAPYAGRRARRFAVRAAGRLPGGGGEEGTVGPREAAAAALVASLRSQGRLRPDSMRAGALYDPVRLEELLERAATRPAAVDWEALGRILTVELSLEAAGAALA